ncbi:unnamed protein product [Rotaria sp. Silwood1]|nr:unnamed protein product [Rotaria sp. Silwood1]
MISFADSKFESSFNQNKDEPCKPLIDDCKPVFKSLFPTNYQSLRYKLGGLLNRRIFPFTGRRDMNFNNKQINQIFKHFQQGLHNCDIILTSPEDILSFDLLTIDKCRKNEFNVGRSMLTIQRWLKKYIRDVLDESDEILHVKYQLTYTVGSQEQVDGGTERWKTIQKILELVKKHSANISKCFSEKVCYKPSKRNSAFPQFRLQSHEPYALLSIILTIILETHSSVEHLINKFTCIDIQLFLIVRGLLSLKFLLITFRKRYRVNYGVNPSLSFNRLMAVPFPAKDVVADRPEFGLNNSQLFQCFNCLNEEETDPTSIYDQWVLYEDEKDVPKSIQQWIGVNLKDYQQRIDHLFSTFRYNMIVINYFRHYFVFPREAKQFLYKLVTSAWDLSSSLRSKIITGFSGTNDTQLLLPVHIRQYDLPELQKTDAIVVNNLLKNVGTLFIDGTNRDIAVKWLNQSDKNKIDYIVYFDFDSIIACDRQLHLYALVTFPARTDFKFPMGFKVAITLGNGLTKDRFVQARMRMRKLVYENTQQSTWDGLHHWVTHSLNFQRKISAFRRINWNNDQQIFTDILMQDLAKECSEPEIIELKSMYGSSKKLQTLFEIHHNRYEQTHHNVSKEIKDTVLRRLKYYGETNQRLLQLLDEEQQRELEQELEEEERQLERPSLVTPCQSRLHEEIKQLCDMHSPMMNLKQHPKVFRHLSYAFTGTTFVNDCQANSWQENFWISTEFQRVITTKGELLNSFLLSPRWIIIYRNRHLIFLSALEANWVLGRLRLLYYQQQSNNLSIITLHLLLPRIKRVQSIFVNTSSLTIPPLIRHLNDAVSFFLPLEWLVQLFIFNGTIYFETVDEQIAYCQCLSLCPKSRTVEEEEAFKNGWIAVDGFVSNIEHCHYLKMHKVRFHRNLLIFVKQKIENRNNLHAPITSHVGSIILNSLKLI